VMTWTMFVRHVYRYIQYPRRVISVHGMVMIFRFGNTFLWCVCNWKWIPCSQVVTAGESRPSIFFMSFIYLAIFKFGPLKPIDCMTAGKNWLHGILVRVQFSQDDKSCYLA
jgi:hypothetical protein